MLEISCLSLSPGKKFLQKAPLLAEWFHSNPFQPVLLPLSTSLCPLERRSLVCPLMPSYAHGRGVRGERGGSKGKELGGGREDGYLKKICCIMHMKSCLKVYIQRRCCTSVKWRSKKPFIFMEDLRRRRPSLRLSNFTLNGITTFEIAWGRMREI